MEEKFGMGHDVYPRFERLDQFRKIAGSDAGTGPFLVVGARFRNAIDIERGRVAHPQEVLILVGNREVNICGSLVTSQRPPVARQQRMPRV